MSVNLDAAAAETILKGIKIPPQPQIMVDIEMELVMPDPDMKAIADLIARDVGLSGSVLKIVNSSLFGLRNKVSAIPQAISLLGINSIVNLVNALSIRGSLSDGRIVALNDFWDNSMDIATACAAINTHCGFKGKEEAYTLGLFHNAAIPLLMQRFKDYPTLLEQAYRQPDGDINRVEMNALHTSHSIIGHYVARTWKLPEHLCEVIAHHHDCQTIFNQPGLSSSRFNDLLAVLKLAEHICQAHRAIGGCAQDYEFEILRDPILHYLGMSPTDLGHLTDDLIEQGIAHRY